MTYFDQFDSPIGQLLLTSDGKNLTGLYLENHKYGPEIGRTWVRNPEAFAEVRAQLDDYFKGQNKELSIPMAPTGTAFQRAVWHQLIGIPFGSTITYGDIAWRLGRPKASRAVGAAVGRNPISIVIPCHRVVGSNGSMTGYAGGLDRKRALLWLEGIDGVRLTAIRSSRN